MKSSGADRGFFQPAPILPNQFHDDASFRRCFKLFLPADVAAECEAEVAALGKDVLSDKVFSWISDAERNKPYLRGQGRDAFGRFHGELVTGEGWRKLQSFGLSRGIVATGYDTPYGAFSRPLQYLRMHLWEASSANVTCPSAMQDGAASLLRKHLASPALSDDERKVFEDAYCRLTSRNPSIAWTSGQWMTERSGGSDVSQTETMAIYQPDVAEGLASKDAMIPLGPWSINGFKWFSSATDSNMTVLLARTVNGGLTTFLAPMRRYDSSARSMTGQLKANGTRLNGVWIQRLKTKLGTQPLATAELVLEDMRAWKIGEEGKGIHEISTILTLTRIHNVITAVGYVGRGLGIARAYARRREVGAGRGARMMLTESSLHMRTLAKMTAEYHGLMLLSYFCCYNLGLSEHKDTKAPTPALAALTPESRFIEPLLRVVVQLAKAYICKTAVPLLYSCMESLGGVGYLVNEEQEYLNIARLYRDCCVLPIWEGTTDVLSTDFIRALKQPTTGIHSLEALESFIENAIEFQGTITEKPSGWDPLGKWSAMREYIETKPQPELIGEGREILWDVAEILVSVLLYVDAATDGNTATKEIFRRFVEAKFSGSKHFRETTAQELSKDLNIAYGLSEAEIASREVISKL